jgi:ribose/xylose/arabinose/galactoside ABC-type transport system permease subunit
MIAVYVLVGVLAVIASGFLAADISDADFHKRPENRNYD